nr:two-component response regulator ARR12-like [Ipomoea batatas]
MGISKRVCLFVFNEDYICQNLVSEVLQHCSYEVLHIGRAMDALTEIGKRKHGISVVLTNMNRLKAKGAEIIKAIQEELNLRVCLILPGNMEFNDTRGLDCNVSAYIVNFSDTNDMKELWQSAFEKEKARKAATTTDNNEHGNDHHNRKAKELREEQSEESGSETRKKPRLSWNPEMHQRFVEAVNKLGFDKAVPKKIVEFMNEPGLTREHVASHLQKYSMNLRKGQDSSRDFIYGDQKLINDVTNPFFGSCLSALKFNSSHTYSSFPFERNNSVFSTPLLAQYSYLLNPNISATLTQQPHMFPTNNLLGALNHIFPTHQQASFPAAFCSSPYTENNSLLQGISGQGINTNDHPTSIVSLPPLLPGNSENLSSKQIESSSVIEINSYGGEEDISALLDAADNDTPNNNPEEGLWDDDDDFSDILSGFTK